MTGLGSCSGKIHQGIFWLLGSRFLHSVMSGAEGILDSPEIYVLISNSPMDVKSLKKVVQIYTRAGQCCEKIISKTG